MPITVEPFDAAQEKTVIEPLKPNSLHPDKLDIDWSDRTKPPIADITITPYLADENGVPITYASKPIEIHTDDFAAAARNIPELATARDATEAGIRATFYYLVARKIDLETAKAAASARAVAFAVAAAAEVAALAAANVAFTANNGVAEPTTQNAWKAAVTAREAAQADDTTAKNRLTIAQAAVDDIANPPLV